MTARTREAIAFGEPPLEPYRAGARTLCHLFGCSNYPEPHCLRCGSSYVAWVEREVADGECPEKRRETLEDVSTWDHWPLRIERGCLYPVVNLWRNVALRKRALA